MSTDDLFLVNSFFFRLLFFQGPLILLDKMSKKYYSLLLFKDLFEVSSIIYYCIEWSNLQNGPIFYALGGACQLQ